MNLKQVELILMNLKHVESINWYLKQMEMEIIDFNEFKESGIELLVFKD